MSDKHPILFRPLRDSDVPEYSDLLYNSFNIWYWKHGWGKDYFGGKSHETERQKNETSCATHRKASLAGDSHKR
jgi:hypothetical protein